MATIRTLACIAFRPEPLDVHDQSQAFKMNLVPRKVQFNFLPLLLLTIYVDCIIFSYKFQLMIHTKCSVAEIHQNKETGLI